MGIYFNPGNGSFTKDKNSQLATIILLSII